MQYFPEIIPLFEARMYLMQRFSKDRTSDRVAHFEPKRSLMSDEMWTYFSRIAELQNELDKLIPVDELMEHYFTPLRTQSDMPGDRSLTLGGMLLSLPPALEYPFSFDEFVTHRKNEPQQELLDDFFTSSLSPFFTDNSDLDVVNMSKIVSAVNSILVDIEDKWAMIDCITNPCEHLEKLRPLVERVMELIVEKSREFSDFITAEMDALCSSRAFAQNLGSVIRSDIKPADVAEVKVYASLLSFNSVDMSYEFESFAFNRIIIGIYINTFIELRGKDGNAEVHLQMLKMLSDPTRFKVLHELCDRESYGQELADKFGGARSAIYYHLEKLLGYGLVDLQMTEYRMLYTMNKQNVYDKMNAIRDYLLNGWKPEPKQEENQE